MRARLKRSSTGDWKLIVELEESDETMSFWLDEAVEAWLEATGEMPE